MSLLDGKGESVFGRFNHKYRLKYERKFFNTVRKELKEIKPYLENLISYILKENPDKIYFLGNSTHIFRLPFAIYLKEKYGIENKVFSFSDKDLKLIYREGKMDEELINYILGDDIKDKKIFFVDETFANGLGACTIKKTGEILGNSELFYFSFSHEPGNISSYVLGKEDLVKNTYKKIPTYLEDLQAVRNSDKFIISDYTNGLLFSRVIKRKYLAYHKKYDIVLWDTSIKMATLLEKRKKDSISVGNINDIKLVRKTRKMILEFLRKL